MNTTHTCIALVGLALCSGAALGQGQPPGEGSVSRAEHEALRSDLETLRAEMAAMRKARQANERAAHQDATQAPTWIELERMRLRQDMIEQTLLEARYGESNFHFTGFAFTRFTNVQGADSSFTAVVAPIILWELSDRLLFETELEFGLETEDGEGKTEVELEYAHASYILNDYVTLGAGKFLTPFGIFGERLHPAWINKLPDAPLAFGHHGGLVPMSSLGAYVRGGFPLGDAKGNYAFYLSNGPSLNVDGHGVGTLDFENFDDINNNKAFGGRVGFLPFPEIEIGYSFQFADVTPSGFDQQADALLQSIDVSYVTESDLLGGLIDLRFEWVFSDVDDVAFAAEEGGHADEGGHAEEEEDGDEAFITFNNERSGGYLQLAFRPTKSDMEFLRNLEFVGRYGWLDLPSGAPDAFDQERWTLGVNYWLNPSTVLKIAYEHTEVDGGDDFDAVKAMFAIGF
ncbi:MAG: hypothetical protein IIB53_03630 [Planctomycetes bacterium]|nr:hypothetical protein [Planctomycetota bacterium]